MADIELVIKIPEGLKNDFESEQWTALSCMAMKDALMQGTPLPKGATNGDMIKAIFPNYDEIELTEEYPSGKTYFSGDWWNAPYKYRKVRNKDADSN